MAQGSLMSSALFQKMMNELLSDMIAGGKVLCYQDDLLVHSTTPEDHLAILEQLFERLNSVTLAARPSKCSFFQPNVVFLGHKIDERGAVPIMDRVLAIKELPIPRSVRQVRSFIGAVNFYRKFIPNITEKAAPLYNLIKKGVSRIKWTEECDSAFNTLKEALCSAPLLIHPDFKKTFYVKSDASWGAIGGVLEQLDTDGCYQPIAYCSRKLNKAERNYSTIEKEALGLVYSLEQFRHFIYGYEVVVKTDHKPLSFIFKLKEKNQRITRWLLTIQDFNLKIEHLPGCYNVVADMLSRGEELETSAFINSILKDDVLTVDLIKKHQAEDAEMRKIMDNLLHQEDEDEQFILDEGGVVCKKITENDTRAWRYRVLVPPSLRSLVISLYHDKGHCAHFSKRKVIWKVRQLFTWAGMLSDIAKYIKTCEKCQRRNLHTKKAPFQPQSPPSFPFQKLSIDFLGPFERSDEGGYRYLLLFIDQFTRYPIGVPTHDMEASTVAKAYIENVYAHYGGSEYILSDRGANFTSKLFNGLCEKLGIKHLTTTAFHPQSNGVVERANRVILNILSQLCNSSYRSWATVLPLALREIRRTIHQSTNESPNYLLYGFDPIDCGVECSLPPGDGLHENIPEFVEVLTERMIAVRGMIEANLTKASITSCKARNKNRTPFSFAAGDKVLLLDSTSFSGKNRKLKARYRGPYRIVQLIGLVNAKVVNIKKSKDTQVVHIDKLKPYFEREVIDDVHSAGGSEVVSHVRPSTDESSPEQSVLGRRATRSNLKLSDDFFQGEGRYLKGRKYNG